MSRENHPLFPDTFYTAHLETWADAIQQLASKAEQCLLERVVHYKALSDTEHEFLVVYASHPSGSKIVLGVDRNSQGFKFVSAASKLKRASASQGTDTTQPSTEKTVASSSARCFNTLMSAKSTPLYSSSSSSSKGEELSHLAYDRVQVSHDGTPEPILAQHRPSDPLYMITFPSTSCRSAASTCTTSSGSDAKCHPSLLRLSVLLLTIHTHFPSYALLRYQCFFFARATCLALMGLRVFGGVKTELEGGKRAGTWHGVHISLYSAGRTVLQNMLLLPLIEFPILIVPAGLFAVYSAVRLYDGDMVGNEVDRCQISDEKIRQHICKLYRKAWDSFVLERRLRWEVAMIRSYLQ